VSKQKTAQRRNAELVSGVSHEMKTPLAGIKAYVELLADGDAEDSATQEEFLGVISSQADRLLQLVDNLVTVAEVEAATAGAGKRPWPLEDLLGEALRLVEPLAAAKQIALGSDFDQPNCSVLADRRLLVQAAVQVLSNAVKYTPAGGRVVMRSRAVGDRVRVEIEDNGVGLGPEDCIKVFEKFYRVPQFKGMAPGTGLGLPLARHIVENLHGGTLTVESQPGEGSLFAVELSLAGTR
jgi:two-component system phosphate regulon sensor histidine kinase PhoR